MSMSYLWVGMVLYSLLCFAQQGYNISLTASVLEGAKSAIDLSLTLAGSLCLWCGLSRVMELGGVLQYISQVLKPVFSKIFPKASRDSCALAHISANFSANFLGLGNAATPLGILATKRMRELEGVDYASDELCRLVILNTASVQLIPTTVATLRASLGSNNPLEILPVVWVTSLASVTAGLLASLLLSKVWGRP